MSALGLGLLVVLAIRMVFVVVVTVASAFSVMLTVAMGLCLGVCSVAMAIIARTLGLATLQDECSRTNTHGDDDGNGDEVLFTDSGFAVAHDVSPCWVTL